MDLSVMPINMKFRTVKVYDEDGEFVKNENPASTYCWVVHSGSTQTFINGDFHLPCEKTEIEDQGEPVATLMKIHPITKAVKYGPAPVYQAQYAEWVRLKRVTALVVDVRKVIS